MSGENGGSAGLTAIGPTCGGCLRIEVYHGRVAFSARCNGQMKGQGTFS